MPLKRRTNDTPETLSAELRQVLLFGPHSIGKTLHDYDHDALRVVWQAHKAELLARAGRTPPWFVDRDWFVRVVRREPEDE